jgi:murein DD-endopeptidase MepM/ murein hydrolase activator NlpD
MAKNASFSICLILLFTFCSELYAFVPGGIAQIYLEIPSTTPPTIYYNDAQALVMRKEHSWVCILGLPLTQEIGTAKIEIHSPLGIQTKNFTVKEKKYPIEKLTIPNKRKVQPFASDLTRIAKETALIQGAYKSWHVLPITELHLQRPVKGRESSQFGQRRILNGIEKSQHSGLDIAAPIGTPVLAAKDGFVITTEDFFYSGKTVIVNHGQGFITSYSHLDTILSQPGDNIQQGEVIGTIGKTGRVTGPHLHWSVVLNGALVDPKLFLLD